MEPREPIDDVIAGAARVAQDLIQRERSAVPA